ncbi:TolC family protein [Horticoccus luteus]|uniref:TolC family protein n=1 Tax=Horticoccus luteus TaxID=2862869 RepID=A0A8F9TX05_9BACT|nr:TolC family protein [Horticoccus luteus]QYM80670.1 TolC family protein [Horticoccus luteus]
MLTARTALLVFVATFTFAAASPAQSPAPAAPAGSTLTLQQAIAQALRQNRTIKVQAYDPAISRANVLTAYGRFDPALTFRRSYSEDNVPFSANPVVNQLTKTDDYSLTLDGLSPIGTQYSLGASAENLRGTFNGFADNYVTFGGLTVTQPLLRGFGFGANLYDLRVARADRGIADWTFRQTVIDTITSVIYAYNNLINAQQQLRVAQRSRELAAQLVGENEKRFQVGSMSASDVTEARARTATREEAVIVAEQGVRDSDNALRRLIGEKDFPLNGPLLTVETPDVPAITVDPVADYRRALDLRPDYRSSQLGVAKRAANRSYARNQLLPRVDFVGSYGYNGLDPSFAASRHMVADRDRVSYSAGVVVSVPLTFADGRGRARAARLQLAQAEADLDRLEQDIALNIAHAAADIDTSRRRVAANQTAYDLAKQALDAELKKLRAGQSSTFFVLNLQEELSYVETALSAALAAQRRAVAAYDREIGTTLERYHVTLTPSADRPATTTLAH